MKNRQIHVEVDTSVSVQDVINELEFDDVYDWISSLPDRDKIAFTEGLADCFNDVPLSDLLGGEWALEEALDVITKAWYTSPYERGKIRDILSAEKII